MNRRVKRRGVAAALSLGLFSGVLHASAPLGADRAPIRTSAYSVDLTLTPVLSSARITGLGGAYVAIAEGLDGDLQNPAAPAVRTSFSYDHFDYELGLGLTLPATLTSTDFFNTGREHTQLSNAEQRGFVFITPAINLAWGELGLGATAEISNYTLRRNSDPDNPAHLDALSAVFVVGHLQIAHLFLKKQLAIGAGLRVLNLSISNPDAVTGARDLFATSGVGLELGAVYMPTGLPFRVGTALRSGVSTEPDPKSQLAPNASGDRVVGDPNDAANSFWLPNRVVQPWELNVGAAVQFGPRPLNPAFTDPKDLTDPIDRELDAREEKRATERRALDDQESRAGGDPWVGASVDAARAGLDGEDAVDELERARVHRDVRQALKRRHARLPRRYVLVSVSLVVDGTVKDAVGVESFLQRVVGRSGQSVTYSPRLGVETELIPRWLQIRVGTYDEPSRFATSENRLHGTVGFDAKVLHWAVFGLFDRDTEWRISTSLDAARRYLGWGISFGTWH